MPRTPLLPFLIACSFAVSSSAERVELILDGSGSMWADAGGEAKIVAAKRLVTELVTAIELPPEATIGLTVYGHRRKGDCADIERFAPVVHGQRAGLLPTIAAIQPKGKTPIAASLRRVGDSLRGREDASSIVLISDGVESCDEDPCAVARRLREDYGIEVVIHVVGFDVRDGREQLRCIAEAGGGEFFAPSNAGELADALEVVRVALEEPPPPAPAAEPEAELENVAAAANGGRVVLFSSAYSNLHADNLIDEAQDYWMSSSAAPQSIVLGFAENRRAEIAELLVNPFNTQGQERWAHEVEVYVSEDSPYEGFRLAGAMTLEPLGTEQLHSFERPVTGRFVKLNFLSNHGDRSHIAAGEVMLMGRLLDPDDGQGPPPNLVAAANGGSVEKATSEYGSLVAANLIDGSESYWLSSGASAQDVTLRLPGGEPRPVAAVAINPHNGQVVERWAKEVELFVSLESSYKGFVSLGKLDLRPVGEYQVLRLPEPVRARFLRLRFLSNHGDRSHIAAGEVVVLAE